MQENNFVIAGGGTAGWITAAVLSSMFSNKKITLIENSKIGTIGVGESTTPAILDFLALCEIDLLDFMVKTESTIKVGIKFENWTSKGSSYFHSFELVKKKEFLSSVMGYDYLHDFNDNNHPYNYFLDNNLLPINNTGDMLGTHALHINAHKLVNYLKEKFKDCITVIDDKIINTDISAKGIDTVYLESGKLLQADVFFDCTGFNRVLHSKVGSEWKSCKDILPVDRAIPCPIAWDKPMNTTHASALSSGWVWQVPLQNRLGSGYVYSSEFAKNPEDEYINFIKKKYNKDIQIDRTIKFDSGYVKNPWNKNVLCVGLSSGFVEPLESTSIHMIYHQVLSFVHNYDGMISDQVNKFYNDAMVDMYDDTVAFIKLHYMGNQGVNDFWDYMNTNNCDRLNEFLELWKYHLPNADHIGQSKNEVPGYRLFAIAAWLQVMQGMNKIPKENLQRYISYNGILKTDSYVNNLITQEQFLQSLTQFTKTK
jgi:tryptophan halogenase